MTYDNIKSRKKQGFTLSLESDFLKKTKEGGRGGVSFNYKRRKKITVTLNSSIRNYFDTYCLLVEEVDGKAR